MRRKSIHVLVASVSILAGMSGSIARAEDAPTSVYSDPRFADRAGTDNQNVYEKMASVSPMDGGSGASRDFDAERAKFDDAVKTLNKTKDDVVSRLQNDPQFAPLEKSLADSKAHYDDEIDDALATMSWYDDYQDLIAAADKGLQQLQFITKNSPDDKQTLANAQRHFDEARRAVETYEDDTLDLDPYVQAARQSFIATRDARDKAIDQALASDLAVKSAQARVDELKQNLDALAANMPKGNVDQNAQARRDNNQQRQQPYDNGQPGQTTEPSPEPEQPMVYDNGDSTSLPPSEYIAPEGGAYDYPPSDYAESDVAYPEPYYSDYPYYYGGYPSYGLFLEIRSRYHHDHDHDSHDHYHHDHSNYDHGHQDYHDYRNNHGWANSGSNSGRYGSGSRDEQQARADMRDYQRQRESDFNNQRANQSDREMRQQAELARQAALREQQRREEFRADARRQDTQVNPSRREQQVRQADAQRVEAQRQADAQNTRARQRDMEAQAYAASQARAEQRRSQAEAQARAQADAQARADSQARARDQQQARSRDDGGGSRSSGSGRSSGSSSNSGGGSNDRGGRYHR